MICFGVAPSMHQITCARFFFSPRSLNSIGFGWVCKSFHGNIAPTVLPRCFGGFIVDAPISTVLSVTSNPFWWLRHLFLHFWNLVWFAAVPTGKHPLLFQCFGGFIVGACISAISVLDLQSLLGCCIPWVLVGPAFVPTGMEHQFLHFLVILFIEFPISAIYYWMCSLFGGCAIYSCIFGFWLGLQVFPWQYSTYSRGVLVDSL